MVLGSVVHFHGNVKGSGFKRRMILGQRVWLLARKYEAVEGLGFTKCSLKSEVDPG